MRERNNFVFRWRIERPFEIDQLIRASNFTLTN